ncbi:MAG: YicC/YloC family endoribonuclease [Coxiella endosymbiont of Haemaphysalis qinghaiensis]
MIASMTAFAKCSYEASWGTLKWEIRTVNHRYLEVTLRMPEFLRDFEQSSRAIIQNYLSRGKVETILNFQTGQEAPIEVKVNQTLTEQLAKACETVLSFFPLATVNVMDVLAWPGVLQTKETEVDVMKKAILDLLKSALDECVSVRQREGEKLQVFLEDRIKISKKLITSIKKRMPLLLKAARERMMARFEEFAISLDKERLEQEMLWLAQKMDVSEELQRLETHINEVKRVLDRGGVVGRRLDFLMQELNREANTLGNKSIGTKVSQAVIELKVQIEQMREQIQNIE